jgi:hypothetical protein
MDFARVRENLALVRDEIARIRRAESTLSDVRVIAVTKGQPVEAIAAAAAAGILDIGENRVQEALDKRVTAAVLPVRWHLIGHLQSNKAKHVPGNFSVVHSIDSLKLARALARAWRGTAQETDGDVQPLGALLQVNLAGEAQKSGCAPDQVAQLAHEVVEMPELNLAGLMTMAPLTEDEVIQRKVFGALRELRDRLTTEGLGLPELSMGMSGDFRSAVAEGATMVRLGTVLFGKREQ